MKFDPKILIIAMVAGAILPIVAFATGEIVAVYLAGAVGIAAFVVVGVLVAAGHPNEAFGQAARTFRAAVERDRPGQGAPSLATRMAERRTQQTRPKKGKPIEIPD